MRRSTLNFLVSLGAWIAGAILAGAVTLIHRTEFATFFEAFLGASAIFAFIVAVAAFCRGMSLREELR